MLHVFSGIILLFLVLRFVVPLKTTFRWKVIVTLLLLIMSQQHLVNRTIFGTLASPEMPAGVLAFQGWMLSSFLLLAVFALLRDISALLLRLSSTTYFRRNPVSASRPVALGLFSAALALSAVLSAVGVWQAIRVPDVRTVEISLRNLPPELHGFRIVQISDLHANRLLPRGWVKAVVEKANALEPDLILLTGDTIDGSTDKRRNDVAPLKDLQARHGIFAVPGNHEYISGYNDWLNAFQALGLRMLQNEHVVIMHYNVPLVVAGTTDRRAVTFGLPGPDIQTALDEAPENAVKILMAHQPGNAREAAAAGIDLQLSGHTHGGQILGLRIISQYANKGFISGLYDVNGMALYVSNGAGLWNGFPVRLGCPPEITEILLRPV